MTRGGPTRAGSIDDKHSGGVCNGGAALQNIGGEWRMSP